MMSVESAVDTQIFDAYVEKFLAPSSRPGDIALLDNVKFHYSERSINMIETAGASVRHIPRCSPDFSPIEECISKIREALRKAIVRTVRKLLNALARALEKITIDDVCGWFAHCGYTFSSHLKTAVDVPDTRQNLLPQLACATGGDPDHRV